jgi:hypothetical protein
MFVKIHRSPLFALLFKLLIFIVSTIYVLSVYVVVLAASLWFDVRKLLENDVCEDMFIQYHILQEAQEVSLLLVA